MLHATRSPNIVPQDCMPEESADEQRTRELTKRLRKLRWIGEDDLARQIADELRAASNRDCIIAMSDTD